MELAHQIFEFLNQLNCTAEVYMAHFHKDTSCEYYFQLFEKYSRVRSLVIFNFLGELTFGEGGKYKAFHDHVTFSKEIISDETHCGVVEPSYFSVNIELFKESKKYNTCLNKKIGVDYLGNIKNCPTLTNIYGNIKIDSIKDIVSKDSFKYLWGINKDSINICKFCEFRYMCTDCRAHLYNLNDKPFKCNYDPVSCDWTA